jgi:hypothetical protein
MEKKFSFSYHPNHFIFDGGNLGDVLETEKFSKTGKKS